MKIPLRQLLSNIAARMPYPPIIQGLVGLTLVAALVNVFNQISAGAAMEQTGQPGLFIGLIVIQLLAIWLVPVRSISCWQQFVFLIAQCSLTAAAQFTLTAPILDYVYLAIVLQAVYLFRAWLWIPFASIVWLVWSGTIIIDSASLVAWLQSNLAVAFPATCILIAAIVYARQQRRHEQAQQMLRQMQHRYDNLVLTFRDIHQHAIMEERQRLSQLITDEMQTVLLRTEQNIATSIQQVQMNFVRVHTAIAQTRDSASAALDHLRSAITSLRRADLSTPNPASASLTLGFSVGVSRPTSAADDQVLPKLTLTILTWTLPLIFVGLVIPLTLLHHARVPDLPALNPTMIMQVVLVCGLLVADYVLTQRIRHPFWLQIGLAGQVVSVMALVILTQTLPLLVGLLLVIWQIALRLSALQILAFLAGIQTFLSAAMLSFMPDSLNLNNNLVMFGVACVAVGGPLWMARHQLHRRHQAEQRLAQLAELAEELSQQATEVRTLAAANERTRMAREFHDDLGYQLTLISIQLQLVEELLAEDPQAALDHLVATREQLHAAWRSVLSAVDALLSLDGQTLHQALHDLVDQCQMHTPARIELRADDDLTALNETTACTIYRTVQEGLTNTCKHASAQHIWIDVRCDVAQISVDIWDDGTGQTPQAYQHTQQNAHHTTGLPGSFGLVGLRERAEALNGSLDVGPLPEGGFRLYLAIPLVETEDERHDSCTPRR